MMYREMEMEFWLDQEEADISALRSEKHAN
jgi:hypothetical protein